MQVSAHTGFNGPWLVPEVTASWAPSCEAIVVAIGPLHSGTTSVFTAGLILLWEQPTALSCMAWSPCSTMLIHGDQTRLGVLRLPGSDSTASKPHRELLSALQHKMGSLSALPVEHVIWSPRGACCVSCGKRLLVQRPGASGRASVSFHLYHKADIERPCLSPSGELLLYIGKNSKQRRAIWLLDMRTAAPGSARSL